MFSFFADYFCTPCLNAKIDNNIADENKKRLMHSDILKRLEINKKSHFPQTSESSCLAIAVNLNTGQVHNYDDVLAMRQDPNCILSSFKANTHSKPIYFIYCTVESIPSKQCIRNLVATEYGLNRDTKKEWLNTIKDKLAVTKHKYGVAQAIRWSWEYKVFADVDFVYSTKELWNL